MVSEALGKEVKYVNITPEQQRETVTKMGLPPFLIDTVCGLDAIKRAGHAAGVSPAVKEIIGREGRHYRAWIQENARVLGGAPATNDPKALLSTLLRRAEDIDRQSNEAIGVLKGLISGAPAHDDHKARDSVISFYRDCLTVNKHTPDPVAAMKRICHEGLACRGSTDTLNRDQWSGQVGYFWKLVPDMKAEIQDMIHEGNRYIVRTFISGAPKGDFFGLPCDGSKSFKVMAIDIHTVEHDLIKEIYHVEDWGTAFKQLK
jgi:predicted ester cyclase